MSNVATNVSTGKPNKSGAIYYGPLTTTPPTSTEDALTGFTHVGYISEDGLTNDNAPSSEQVKAWGGDTVLNLQTERPDSFSFTMLETLNADVLKLVYGDSNVDVSTAEATKGDITVKSTAQELDAHVFVIDMIVRGGKKKRIVIPNGTVSSLETINYKDNEATGYAVTITDVPDSNGVYHYEYIKA